MLNLVSSSFKKGGTENHNRTLAFVFKSCRITSKALAMVCLSIIPIRNSSQGSQPFTERLDSSVNVISHEGQAVLAS